MAVACKHEFESKDHGGKDTCGPCKSVNPVDQVDCVDDGYDGDQADQQAHQIIDLGNSKNIVEVGKTDVSH